MIVDVVVDVGLTRFSEMVKLLLLQQVSLVSLVPQRRAKKLKAAILVIFGFTPLGHSVSWRMISSDERLFIGTQCVAELGRRRSCL